MGKGILKRTNQNDMFWIGCHYCCCHKCRIGCHLFTSFLTQTLSIDTFTNNTFSSIMRTSGHSQKFGKYLFKCPCYIGFGRFYHDVMMKLRDVIIKLRLKGNWSKKIENCQFFHRSNIPKSLWICSALYLKTTLLMMSQTPFFHTQKQFWKLLLLSLLT